MGRLLARLLLAALAAGLALLLVEGGLSFAGGRSLRTLVQGDLPQFRTLQSRGAVETGADNAGAGAGAADGAPEDGGSPLPSNVFDIHPDPAVGRGFRRNATFELHGETVVTDDLGLRKRVTPSRGENPLRIVVLGDSVAFGWGLTAEQSFGPVLEQLLAEHRAPGSRPVEVRTVAVPGWNTHNAAAFLFDHWDRLRPDIVLFLPVGNDLSDSTCTYWSGFGEVIMPDLLSTDPWFHVGYNAAFLKTLLTRRQRGEVRTSLKEAGTVAVECDLGPESRRRFDDTAATLAAMQARLQALHARFYLLPYTQGEFWWILQDRLLSAGTKIPVIPLFGTIAKEDELPTDSHPNARSDAAFATWTAAALIESGDVPGALATPLPQPPGDVNERRGAQPAPAEVRARADAARAQYRETLLPEVNVETGAGCLQVYGSLDAQGRVETRLLVLLAREPGADQLRIEAAPLRERPDLYPLTVAVEVDGHAVGEFTIERSSPGDGADGPRRVALFDLPDLGAASAFDVKLVPERYGVVAAERHWGEVSFQLVSIACVKR